MLGLGRNRAYDLLRSGEIPCRRNGKKYIIAKIHIIEFLVFNEEKVVENTKICVIPCLLTKNIGSRRKEL